MTTKRLLRLVLPLLLLGILLTACGNSSVALSMRESNILNQWKASYTSFTGVKTHSLPADAGQILVVDYDVQVEKGTLRLQVQNADGEMVWEEAIQTGKSDTASLDLNQTGRYTIFIEGDRTSGRWDVSWDLQ